MKKPTIILAVLLLAATAAPAAETVWEGYLYRGREGKLQIGWPVIAMGVMAQPAHVVPSELAKKLEPFVSSVKGSYFFWNYRLEEAKTDADYTAAPGVLVRIRGDVSHPEDMWDHRRALEMRDARLLSVEFVSGDWLRAWARIFKDKRSPFRIDLDRGRITKEETRAFAPVALAILRRMKAAAGPTDAQRGSVLKVDPKALVVIRFRRRTEVSIQRWLTTVSEELGLEFEGLSKLGPLPPETVDIQRCFLASETKAEFLAKVRAAWKGDLGLLLLAHYVKQGNSTTYATADLAEIERTWTAEIFGARKKATQEILGR